MARTRLKSPAVVWTVEDILFDEWVPYVVFTTRAAARRWAREYSEWVRVRRYVLDQPRRKARNATGGDE